MVDQHDGTSDSGLDPEQDAAVRRLLAEARHDEPIPADVAARLAKVAAHLAAERADAGIEIVDLDAHRRRRRAGRLLLAAAAVVVAGVAVGQLLGNGTSGDDADSAADPAATAERNAGGADASQEDGDGSEFEAAPEATDTDSAPSVPEPADGLAEDSAALRSLLPVTLTAGEFDRDVREVYRHTRLAERKAANGPAILDKFKQFDCPDASYGDGLLLPAYYEGEPTVLAFRPPVGSQRMAELLECGTGARLASLSLHYGD